MILLKCHMFMEFKVNRNPPSKHKGDNSKFLPPFSNFSKNYVDNGQFCTPALSPPPPPPPNPGFKPEVGSPNHSAHWILCEQKNLQATRKTGRQLKHQSICHFSQREQLLLSFKGSPTLRWYSYIKASFFFFC